MTNELSQECYLLLGKFHADDVCLIGGAYLSHKLLNRKKSKLLILLSYIRYQEIYKKIFVYLKANDDTSSDY